MLRKKGSQLKNFLIPNIIGVLCLTNVANAEKKDLYENKLPILDYSYLNSKEELNDYILDTGDTLGINFVNAPDLSGLFTVDEQGEIYFERLKQTYVRDLTIYELKKLLIKRYSEFLVNPDLSILVARYKPTKISIKGEIREPSLIKFDSYTSINKSNKNSDNTVFTNENENDFNRNELRNQNDFIITLSSALKRAGGLTAYSDISKIEIIRDIPLSKGGGKKKAVLDFTPFLRDSENASDIRLFNKDIVFIPRLKEADPDLITLSILSGLSPRFMNVYISGQLENPGPVRIPLQGSLSDVMNLTGPRKPLSGKIFLIRYKNDGSLERKEISYSASAQPGDQRNPYLMSGDLITVQNSLLGRTSSTLKAITEPFIGIYTTKELIKNINN